MSYAQLLTSYIANDKSSKRSAQYNIAFCYASPMMDRR